MTYYFTVSIYGRRCDVSERTKELTILLFRIASRASIDCNLVYLQHQCLEKLKGRHVDYFWLFSSVFGFFKSSSVSVCFFLKTAVSVRFSVNRPSSGVFRMLSV